MNKYPLNETTYAELLDKIKEKQKEYKPLIVAIDGRCTSGKSTLAVKLAKDLDATVLKMDDFFLRIEQRTPERYAEPGGNVDRERVEEVLQKYMQKKDVLFQPFDCTKFELAPAITIPYKDILILEGSYSFHPVLQKYSQFKIFMHVDSETQLSRIEVRNGFQKLEMFKSKWIPLEEKYFSAFQVEKLADIYLYTGNEE